MADDVKVKFGGDFTDVPKGAQAAATAAGTKLQSWFKEGFDSMVSSIGSAFAMTSLFDKLKENLSNAKEYFSQLNHAIKTTGAGGDEFQRVASLGKSVGVTMESVGRAMGFFAKNMGAASKDANGHGKILKELGFTNEQITSGSITATEVMAALADQFQKTGNEALLASNAMSLFGRGGREMLPIIQKGKSAILEQAKAVKVYADADLEAAEAAERAAERRESSWKKLWRALTLRADKIETTKNIRDTLENLQSEMTKEGKDYKGADSKEYSERLVKKLKSQGIGYAIQEETFKQMKENYYPGKYRPVQTEEFGKTYGSIIEALNKAKKEEKPNENKLETSAPLISALAASSLQQIGGGDITSVMSGLANNEVASNIARTADATERIANKETPKPGPQTLR